MCNNDVLYIWILSNKFDLKQTIRVLHNTFKSLLELGRKPKNSLLFIYFLSLFCQSNLIYLFIFSHSFPMCYNGCPTTILLDIYSFGNLVSCGNAANNKEHKLMLHLPFFHSDHLVIKVQITIWAPTPFNIHWQN